MVLLANQGNLFGCHDDRLCDAIFRCVNGETPLQMARRFEHSSCVTLLEEYQPPTPRYVEQQWLHSAVDRTVS